MDQQSEVTQLLRRANDGDRTAMDALVPQVYDELRRLAHAKLAGERTDHTLSTTALVHEAYLRLVNVRQVEWRDRVHFLSMAARTMRRVLVDYARSRGAQKRGGDWTRVTLGDEKGGLTLPAETIEMVGELDVALGRLEAISPRQSQLLELRYFGGLKLKECAEALGISVSTVTDELRIARAWLTRELGPQMAG